MLTAPGLFEFLWTSDWTTQVWVWRYARSLAFAVTILPLMLPLSVLNWWDQGRRVAQIKRLGKHNSINLPPQPSAVERLWGLINERSSSVSFWLSRLPLTAHAVSVPSFSCWYGLCCEPKSYRLLEIGAAADPAWISPSTIDYSSLFRGNWSTCYLVSQRRQIKTCSSIELRGALSLVLRVWVWAVLWNI